MLFGDSITYMCLSWFEETWPQRAIEGMKSWQRDKTGSERVNKTLTADRGTKRLPGCCLRNYTSDTIVALWLVPVDRYSTGSVTTFKVVSAVDLDIEVARQDRIGWRIISESYIRKRCEEIHYYKRVLLCRNGVMRVEGRRRRLKAASELTYVPCLAHCPTDNGTAAQYAIGVPLHQNEQTMINDAHKFNA